MEDIILEVELTQGETGARATLTHTFPSQAHRAVRHSAEDWKKIFKEFHASGLSAVEFCRLNNIPERSFYRYKADYLMGAKENNREFITLVFGSKARVKVAPDISTHALTKLVRLIHMQMRGLAAAKRSTSASPPKA